MSEPCCKDWLPGMENLNGLTSLAYTHGVYWQGPGFFFCPWCGTLRDPEGANRRPAPAPPAATREVYTLPPDGSIVLRPPEGYVLYHDSQGAEYLQIELFAVPENSPDPEPLTVEDLAAADDPPFSTSDHIAVFHETLDDYEQRIERLEGGLESVWERFRRFDEIPGQWSLEWDQPGRQQFVTLQNLLDNLATRLIAVEHNLDGFASRDDAIINRVDALSQLHRERLDAHVERDNQLIRQIASLEAMADPIGTAAALEDLEARLATLEQIAGYGSAAAPAGEPGRGERSEEGEG